LIDSVLDFHYFTVDEVIEYMTRLYKEQCKSYNDLSEAYVKQKADLITVIVQAKKNAAEKDGRPIGL